MTVLGTTRIDMSFGYGTIHVHDAYVVYFLPWQVQISMDHPAFSYDEVHVTTSTGCENPGDDWRDKSPNQDIATTRI